MKITIDSRLSARRGPWSGCPAVSLAPAWLLGLSLALGVSLPASGQIYTAKDAQGRTIISDTPITGGSTRKVTGESGSPSSGSGAANGEKSLADKDMEFRKRLQENQDKAQKDEKTQKEANERKQACERSRNYLGALESGERITKRSETGERMFLDDDQRAAEIAIARRNVEQNCK